MKTTTELIDVMNRAEAGERLTVRVEDDTYSGEVRETHYAAPESDEEGVVGLDLRIAGGDRDGERLEVRSTAGSNTQKFSRPVVRFAAGDGTEHEVLDLSPSEE
ncbi:hypothetical protein [Natronomonas amylolytica]|uniref:hypothetical protein n=1 Tax=Natronomonas amylolytica TaxID=3108498 RepID=UPI003009C96B